MRNGIIAVMIIASTPALAQDGERCFSKATRFNVCAKAREIHAEFVKSLPMRLNKQLVASSATVIGPRITLSAVWELSVDDLNARLQSTGGTTEKLADIMQTITQNYVCSQSGLAAFVRLGGEMEYAYRTLDGGGVASPIVRNCPTT